MENLKTNSKDSSKSMTAIYSLKTERDIWKNLLKMQKFQITTLQKANPYTPIRAKNKLSEEAVTSHEITKKHSGQRTLYLL